MKAFHESRSYKDKINLPITISKNKNMNFLAHWHTDVEIMYVYNGSLRVGINREVCILKSGEFAVCSSGDIHYYDSTGLDSKSIMLIFHPSIIDYVGGWPEKVSFKSSFIDNDNLSRNGLDGSYSAYVNNVMNYLFEEMREEKQFYSMFVKSKLFELCGSLLRQFPTYPIETKIENRRLNGIKMMQDVFEFLEQNYMRPITLEQAAYQAKISPFYFSRLFKSLAGMNFKTYLNSIRISKAEEMIKEDSSKNITNIALECGFNSVRTFNRVFKALKDYTPSQLRN